MGPPGWALVCLKMETEQASETRLRNQVMDKGTKKKVMSVNLRCVLDFLTLEGGTSRLFQNFGAELRLYAM